MVRTSVETKSRTALVVTIMMFRTNPINEPVKEDDAVNSKNFEDWPGFPVVCGPLRDLEPQSPALGWLRLRSRPRRTRAPWDLAPGGPRRSLGWGAQPSYVRMSLGSVGSSPILLHCKPFGASSPSLACALWAQIPNEVWRSGPEHGGLEKNNFGWAWGFRSSPKSRVRKIMAKLTTGREIASRRRLKIIPAQTPNSMGRNTWGE